MEEGFPSPQAQDRFDLYHGQHTPLVMFGGIEECSLWDCMDYNNYVTSYNSLVNNTAYVDVNLNFSSTNPGTYLVTADTEVIEDINTADNKIILVIAGWLPNETRDPGYWNYRVLAASDPQDFNLNSIGEVSQFTASIDLDISLYEDHGAYEEAELRAVAIVQSYDNLMVLQSEMIQFGMSDSPESEVVPESVTLNQNWPNPFNPETTISFSTKEACFTKLAIYNPLGQKIKTLVNQSLNAGDYSYSWQGNDEDGKAVSSGIYFYILKSGDNIKTKKMVLLK